MLVISRRPGGDGIIIGGDVKVKVLEIKSGGVVRLGIEAPRDTIILREEIVGTPEEGKYYTHRDPDCSDSGPVG